MKRVIALCLMSMAVDSTIAMANTDPYSPDMSVIERVKEDTKEIIGGLSSNDSATRTNDTNSSAKLNASVRQFTFPGTDYTLAQIGGLIKSDMVEMANSGNRSGLAQYMNAAKALQEYAVAISRNDSHSSQRAEKILRDYLSNR
jgi:hypothetical protein